MYRRPKFLSILIRIREAMSREADYDVDLFTEMVRSGSQPQHGSVRNIRGFKKRVPRENAAENETLSPRKRAAR